MLIGPGGGAAGRQIRRLRADFGIESEALVRRLVWRAARRIAPVIAVDMDGMRFFVSTGDQTLGRRLFCYRRVPQRDIARAFAVLEGIPGVPERMDGGTVLEIGANIGSHTVEFLQRYGARSVIAIEPDPGNASLLRQNVLANGFAGRARLLELAASDLDGTVELELSETNPGDHRVRVNGAREASAADVARAAIEVRAARIDTLVADGEIDPAAVGLVWMDVQGHEAHVLRGAGDLLGSDIPIVMEYWPDGLRRAGGLDELHELIARRYEYVIDLCSREEQQPRVLRSEHVHQLEHAHGWDERGAHVDPATDLILARGVTLDLTLPRV